jgi:hypothetical protein
LSVTAVAAARVYDAASELIVGITPNLTFGLLDGVGARNSVVAGQAALLR